MATRTSRAGGAALKAGKTAAGARENPYVQRMIEDAELRENVRDAFESARHAYKRMSNGKAPGRALLEDKKLQRDLRQATDSLKEAADQLRGKRRKRGRKRRILLLLVVGAAVVLAVNEGARKALLDKLFGAEEEFEYSSTTSPG